MGFEGAEPHDLEPLVMLEARRAREQLERERERSGAWRRTSLRSCEGKYDVTVYRASEY